MDRKHYRLRPYVICLFLIAGTLACYWQIKNHEFIDFDDDLYVSKNREVQAGLSKDSIKWAFKVTDRPERTYWHPLTWLSHMLDCALYGVDAGMHHLSNLGIHIINSLLLFMVLMRLSGTLWRSAAVAALFAVHPLNVETVAWIAERKNLLSTLFWMLTLLSYVSYVRRPRLSSYLLVLLVLSLGLMAKPMLVTLPFTLLLLDYWPLGRLRLKQQSKERGDKKSAARTSLQVRVFSPLHLLLEKAPLIVVALITTYLASLSLHSVGTFVPPDSVSVELRIGNALISYVKYTANIFWPHDLAIFYPFPQTVPMWQAGGALLLLASVMFLVVRQLPEQSYLAVGWLWFLGTLVPVIGFVQAGLWPAMADRWAYVPLIGILIVLVWGIHDILSEWRFQRIVLGASAVVVLVALMGLTWTQTRHWKDSRTLFGHAIAVTADNWLAHNNLATVLENQGNRNEAISHYFEALRIKPTYPVPHYNLGVVLARQGKLDEAIGHLYEAVKLKPDYTDAHTNLGRALLDKGRLKEAVEHFSLALRLDPHHAVAHNNLASALERQGKFEQAMEHYSEAVRLRPDFAEAHNNLGSALERQGKIEAAKGHFSEALRLKPDYAEAHYNMGVILLNQQNLEAGKHHFAEALRHKPDYAEAHYSMGLILFGLGDSSTAMQHFLEAVRIVPDHARAHFSLGVILASNGELADASFHLFETIRIEPDAVDAHLQLAVVLERLGRTEEAINHYKRALQLEPKLSKARKRLRAISKTADRDLKADSTNAVPGNE